MAKRGMTVPEPDTSARILLLVEDNPGDADLVAELLDTIDPDEFEIVHVVRLSEAVDRLQSDGRHVDIVLLDLGLPDANGVDTVRFVHDAARETPIVVLTGIDDEDLAIECIQAGAQDYLFKAEIRPVPLRRSLGYAITRKREQQIRELQETLDEYRALSSESATTSVTASLAKAGSVREREIETFHELVKGYSDVLGDYLDHLVQQRAKPRMSMEVLVSRLGDLGGGPRDLIDCHMEALDQFAKTSMPERSSTLVAESRLLALEMMGILVDYYRVGHRRVFARREGTDV
jgi:DNA-binding NarL/FixJ family response regulator